MDPQVHPFHPKVMLELKEVMEEDLTVIPDVVSGVILFLPSGLVGTVLAI